MLRTLAVIVFASACFQDVRGVFEEANSRCRNQFLFFENALRTQRQWALELLDTWGKFQHNVLIGNTVNFGDYDRCIGFSHVTAISTVQTIKGRHCMVSFTSNNLTSDEINLNLGWRELVLLANSQNITLRTGLCLPKSCSSPKDAEEISKYALSRSNLEMTSVNCKSNHAIPFRIRIIAIVIFLTLLSTVVGCTIYELYMRRGDKQPCQTLIAFSIYTNGKNLFDMKKRNSASIECLNGLRSLSLLWIIYGHRYFDTFRSPATNYEYAVELWLRNIWSLTHTMFHLAVDTFFLIGGLLVTQSLMRSFDAKQFNVLKIYFHRYLRYTPVLLFLLLFFVSFMSNLGSGPIFDETIRSWALNCYSNWWSTLLHISTYTNIDNLCMNWTWYLAADFQLFLISPLFIYPAWRWRWKFFFAFPTAIAFSVIYIFVVSKNFKFFVFVGHLQQIGRIDYLRHLYLPTHARCGPWFVGMMLGFVMYRTRNKPLQLRAFVSRTLWVLSISLLFAVVLGFFPFQQPENLLTFSNTANATFNSLFRTCWAFGIAGIIFGCHNGSGSVVGWFLSLPQWQPLARMSLSVYLTHRIYQILSVASLRQPIHIVPSEILHVYFGDVIMSLIVGTLVYLCIEAPFSILEGRLFKSHAQSK